MNRTYWIDMLLKIAEPILHALAERQLKATMPVEKTGERENEKVTHLEALGRTLTGLAPWLECHVTDSKENERREKMAVLAREAIDAATDPTSPDFVNFSVEDQKQPIVDAAFLAHAVLRAPTELWSKLDNRVKQQLMDGLKATRSEKPVFNNWLLFSAMIEVALYHMGEDWDRMRVDYALRQHEQWYVGDGTYGDGPDFQWDYYNSFVIQPMFIDILRTVGHVYEDWQSLLPTALDRGRRYAEVQEKFIAPDGTYPPIGRSLAYRIGAFQHLAQMALQDNLPPTVSPAQVRCALSTVMHRQMDVPGTFDAEGWLTIGWSGSQPSMGEAYISTGSLYLCTAAFLPLGLPEENRFWSDPDADWTSKQLWAGKDIETRY